MCTVEMNFVGRTKWYPCPPKKPAIAVTFFRCCCGLNMFRAQKCNMIYDSQVSNLINVLMNLFSCLCAGCHPATSDWIEIFGWLSVRFYFFFWFRWLPRHLLSGSFVDVWFWCAVLSAPSINTLRYSHIPMPIHKLFRSDRDHDVW